MDEARWPDPLKEFVANATCPQCGTPKAKGVMVTVRYSSPIWRVILNCFRCNKVGHYDFADFVGPMKPKPEPKPAEEPVPVPEWVKNL